jgi:oxidase EvaA
MQGTTASGAADALFRSALGDSPLMADLTQVRDWLRAEQRAQVMAVRQIALDEIEHWHFAPEDAGLRHASGRFFQVQGIRVETDFGAVMNWDQPIIRQPEVGILGILQRNFDGVSHFLMQAKVEPGNINGAQISPTVQATRSNFTRVHGGAAPPYLEYFQDRSRGRLIVDQLQAEQGSRYLRKQNRNMIVQIDEDCPCESNYAWLTLAQIKQLLREPNLVNMDTRSVLACLPLFGCEQPIASTANGPRLGAMLGGLSLPAFTQELIASSLPGAAALHSTTEILHWLTDLRARYEIRIDPRPLASLDGWEVSRHDIRHRSGRYFSVIGVDVQATTREVRAWQQPLLAHAGFGLNGFILQRQRDVLHFLVRACLYPGNLALFELGSTVSRSNADEWFGKPEAPPFLDLFRDAPPHWVRYSAVQSEEGGRFFHYQNRYMILELPQDACLELPEAFRWMTLHQIQDLARHGYFNIEGRNLLACLDLCGAPAVAELLS